MSPRKWLFIRLLLCVVFAPFVHSQCTPPILDILFVIDSTEAVTTADHAKIVQFVRTFVSQKLTIGVSDSRVGVLQFTPQARPEFYPNFYLSNALVDKALPTIKYAPCQISNNAAKCYGATNINASVPYVASLGLSSGVGNRAEVDDVIVIITPGVYKPLSLQQSGRFPPALSKRHVFVLKIGNSGSASGYTVPFATSNNELTATNYDTLQNLVEPLCEEMVTVIGNSGGANVASASVVSGCAAPILIIIIVALILLALMGFVLFRMSRKNKELEKQVKALNRWAEAHTAKSVQVNRGNGSAASWMTGIKGGVSRNDGRYSALKEEEANGETALSELDLETDSRQNSAKSGNKSLGSAKSNKSGRSQQAYEKLSLLFCVSPVWGQMALNAFF